VHLILTVSHHFKPDPYQIANKRHEGNTTPPPEKAEPYRILWWRRTKPWEKTALFYISFKAEPQTDQIEAALAAQFGDAIKKICRWGFWYEVQLNEEFRWDDLISWVHQALKEVA